MTVYTFHEPGSIPGVPGTFANCCVDVRDDGTIAFKTLSGEFVIVHPEGADSASIEEEAAAPPPVEEAAPVPLVAPVTQYIGG